MAKVVSLSQALKVWSLMILAIVLLFFGDQLSGALLVNPNHSLIRWAGVVVAVVCVLPWILTIVWSVGAGDEYVQRIALVGTAIAFVADVLVRVAFNAAQDARLVSWSTHLPALPVAIGLWLLGCGIASLYYRFRP